MVVFQNLWTLVHGFYRAQSELFVSGILIRDTAGLAEKFAAKLDRALCIRLVSVHAQQFTIVPQRTRALHRSQWPPHSFTPRAYSDILSLHTIPPPPCPLWLIFAGEHRRFFFATGNQTTNQIGTGKDILSNMSLIPAVFARKWAKIDGSRAFQYFADLLCWRMSSTHEKSSLWPKIVFSSAFKCVSTKIPFVNAGITKLTLRKFRFKRLEKISISQKHKKHFG